jgi:uncharacterized membrane protein
MAIGPVQLIVLGFDHPDFRGEVLDELQRLRESDTIRVIDSLAVAKDADGEVLAIEMSNLTAEEEVELGAKVGALIGLGAAGEEGFVAGAELGAEMAAEEGIHPFDPEAAWDVLGDIPNDSAAVLLLIEHHWAVPLRDAVARAGGFRIAEDFISPIDLVRVGLMAAEDAEEHSALERGA